MAKRMGAARSLLPQGLPVSHGPRCCCVAYALPPDPRPGPRLERPYPLC